MWVLSFIFKCELVYEELEDFSKQEFMHFTKYCYNQVKKDEEGM